MMVLAAMFALSAVLPIAAAAAAAVDELTARWQFLARRARMGRVGVAIPRGMRARPLALLARLFGGVTSVLRASFCNSS
jgi:hypothetical protein